MQMVHDIIAFPAGEYPDNSVCTSCIENTYGTDGVSCQGCPANKVSPEGSTSPEACSCPLDHYTASSDGSCVTCPGGSTATQGGVGISSCLCPAGRAIWEGGVWLRLTWGWELKCICIHRFQWDFNMRNNRQVNPLPQTHTMPELEHVKVVEKDAAPRPEVQAQ